MEVGRDWETIMPLGEGTPRQSEKKKVIQNYKKLSFIQNTRLCKDMDQIWLAQMVAHKAQDEKVQSSNPTTMIITSECLLN